MPWLSSDTISPEQATTWREPLVRRETLAFLQYTSGSTAAPKEAGLAYGRAVFARSCANCHKLDGAGTQSQYEALKGSETVSDPQAINLTQVVLDGSNLQLPNGHVQMLGFGKGLLLTGRQQAKLAWVAHTNQRLYRAYLLKEELRLAVRLKGDAGIRLLGHWLWWASHCRIPAFVELARKVRRHRHAIEDALRSGTSNALIESTNTKIRVLTRVAFGFRSPQALIAMAMLAVGGVCPDLPGRTTPFAFELTAA